MIDEFYVIEKKKNCISRVFIARSLPSFLPDISPQEAMEYVIPLMNGLAVDEGELAFPYCYILPSAGNWGGCFELSAKWNAFLLFVCCVL